MAAANDSENQTKQTTKSKDFSALLGCPFIAERKQSRPEQVQVNVPLLFLDQPLSKHALGVIGVRASELDNLFSSAWTQQVKLKKKEKIDR